MRYIILSLGAAVLGAIILAACNSTPKANVTSQAPASSTTVQTETINADGARRITIAEANKLIKAGQAFVVDVRTQPAYDGGHIPGAKLIPAGEILNHVDELPRDKTIVTYCS